MLKFKDKKNSPIFIAEISANHNGTLVQARRLIKNAKKYGADLVKLQTYTPDTMTIKSSSSDFKIKEGLWKRGNTLSLSLLIAQLA
jgi:sialic acid synthase SpsE